MVLGSTRKVDGPPDFNAITMELRRTRPADRREAPVYKLPYPGMTRKISCEKVANHGHEGRISDAYAC